MAPTKRNKASKAKPKLHNCSQPNCTKAYASISSLNNHQRSKHSGICWICEFCEETQASKDSHIRHIERRHPEKWREDMNVDKNQFRLTDRANRTDEAKDALIKSLQETIDNQCEMIIKLKTKLIGARNQLLRFGFVENELSDSNSENIERNTGNDTMHENETEHSASKHESDQTTDCDDSDDQTSAVNETKEIETGHNEVKVKRIIHIAIDDDDDDDDGDGDGDHDEIDIEKL